MGIHYGKKSSVACSGTLHVWEDISENSHVQISEGLDKKLNVSSYPDRPDFVKEPIPCLEPSPVLVVLPAPF
jgi:hypothetical protein